MFCKYCGSKMPENAKFCQSCGGPAESSVNPQITNNIPVNNPVVNNQPTNNVPMTVNGSKNNNPILLIILVIVGICAITLPIILTSMSKSNTKEEVTDKPIQQEDKENPPIVEPEVDYPEVEYPTNTTDVQYKGYTFKIPSEYTSMEYDGNLTVMPLDSTWLIMFLFSEGEFDDLKTNLTLFDEQLKLQYSNAKSSYKIYQGQEYILTDFVSDGSAMQMILTDAGNGQILMCLMMPIDTSITFDQLFSIAFPIATTVE